MKKFSYIVITFAALANLSSCTKEEIAGTGSTRALGISAEIDQEGTRASLVNGFSNGDKMKVSVWYGATVQVFNNQEVTYNGTSWSYGTAKNWPADLVYSFYAWYPSTAAFTASSAGVNNFTYSPSSAQTTVSGQTDFMLGYYSGVGELVGSDATKACARIKFSHPLASLQFVEGTIAPGTTITSITVSGVYASATCTPSFHGQNTVTYEWNTAGSEKTGSVEQSVNYTSGTPGTPIGEPFVLIPQIFSGSAPLTVSVTAGGSTLTGTVNMVELMQGYTATLKLNI